MSRVRPHLVYSNLAYLATGFAAALTIGYGVWILAATCMLTVGSMWIHAAEGTGADLWLPGTADRAGMYTLIGTLAIIPLRPGPVIIAALWLGMLFLATRRPGIKWITGVLATAVFAGLVITQNWLGVGLGLPPFIVALYMLQSDTFPYQTVNHGWWHIFSAASVLGIVISYI